MSSPTDRETDETTLLGGLGEAHTTKPVLNHDVGWWGRLRGGERGATRQALACELVTTVLLTAAVVAVAVTMPAVSSTSTAATPAPLHGLAAAMNETRLLSHLAALQEIANAHGGSRAAEFGYNASVAYVVERLQSETDYDVQLQYFDANITELAEEPVMEIATSNATVHLAYVTDFQYMRGSGQGTVEGDVATAAAYGCESSDFTGTSFAGKVAVVSRGECSFEDKVAHAEAAGAVGVVIHNSGADAEHMGIFSGTVGHQVAVPVFSVPFMVGASVGGCECDTMRIRMSLATTTRTITTMNVLATTPGGDPTSTITVGSHLDSVPAGPGINDNGSGSSLNLELALWFYRLGLSAHHRVMFAWWALEERGLVGSTHYVDHLRAHDPEGLANIALNLNFDMMASPNGFRGVYDAASETGPAAASSTVIQRIFEGYWDSQLLSYWRSPFTGRSDYGPFLEQGIPCGGGDTGADEIKYDDMRRLFGGLYGVQADTAYHQPLDNIDNIDKTYLLQMAQAAAYTLQDLAESTDLRARLNYPRVVPTPIARSRSPDTSSAVHTGSWDWRVAYEAD